MAKSLRLLLLFLPLTALGFTWPQVFFQDEFEQGNIAIWPTTNAPSGTSITIASNIVHSGIYSGRFYTPETTATAYVSITALGTNYSTLYTSLRFFIGNITGIANNEFFGVCRLLSSGNGSCDAIYVKQVSGNLVLRTDKLGDCTTVLSTGQWYHVELAHTPGAGSGESTLYLDGAEEKTASSLTLTNAQVVRVGVPYNGFSISATVFIDDVVFAETRNYEPAPFLRFYAPDFRARTGNRIKVITAGRTTGDTLTCWMEGPDGYSNQWHNAIATGADLVKGSYLDAATGAYTFYALLSDSNATPRVTNSIAWEKNYAGNPTYSIDQYNRITKSGTPFFVVDAMALTTNQLATFQSSNMINSVYGQSWDTTYTNYVDKGILHLNAASNLNMYAFVPVTGSGFTAGDGTNIFTTNVIANYSTNTDFANHEYLIGFDWFDEACDQNNYTAHEVRIWNDLTKTLFPGKLTHLNHMGVSYIGPPFATEFNNWRGHTFSMPFQIADIYSADEYPYEYTNTPYATPWIMPWVARNIRYWNHDTIPVMMYIGTGDVRTGLGGAPTTNQLWNMAWSSVAAGAVGIHWYTYQLGTPLANTITMSNFTTMATRLNNVILGTPPTAHATWNNTNIWCKHTTSGTTNYWIVANASTSAQTVTLSHSDIPWGRWIYWDGGSGHITTTAGGFSDTLDAYGVRIYWLDPAQLPDRPRATVIWTTSP